ncbi:5'/3'-nucleotidase SurE [Mariniblastus fucicola]|uniref:5'-nucleotidase n=1 Tax=Mariniblastus fucicola TaxID=980251 RepID=A0A5B9P5T3_9BACT|nr:5'/3'-nucleotidase SurE [Mariniblastus fucicola]QEG20280.1 5'-nucleotidase SurE [Mariniblastus fucicola]
MKILISNDDGWDAPGISTLADVASEFGDCTIVAPETEQSGVSHQVTLNRPLNLQQRSAKAWSIDGTPADCVRIALTQLETQLKTKFDLVLSGVNNGGNLGADVYVSGTVAAAREATLFGRPAIAISQHRLYFGEPFDWSNAATLTARSLRHCLAKTLTPRTLININLPDFSDHDQLPEAEIVDPCPLDPSPRPANYSTQLVGDSTRLQFVGKYNDRQQLDGCDIQACFSKRVTITRLSG